MLNRELETKGGNKIKLTEFELVLADGLAFDGVVEISIPAIELALLLLFVAAVVVALLLLFRDVK